MAECARAVAGYLLSSSLPVNYLDALASAIRAQLPADALPSSNADALLRLYAVLALAKGEDVTAADVHNAWAAWKLDHDAEHASLLPFDELDRATQATDEPYVAAIRAATRARAPR